MFSTAPLVLLVAGMMFGTLARSEPQSFAPAIPDRCRFVCTRIYSPVCGTDGKTYSNPCVLSYFACVSNDKGLEQRHSGQCVVEGPCPRTCSRVKAPVCGSDGRTYSNQCRLRLQACAGKVITVVKDGPCTVTGGGVVPCPTICPYNYAPVCGSNGVTYSNPCTLQVAACQNPRITLAAQGECEDTTTRTPCVFSCPAKYAPVCGSNGKTYGNQCTLNIASCRDLSIKWKSDGECGKGSSASGKRHGTRKKH